MACCPQAILESLGRDGACRGISGPIHLLPGGVICVETKCLRCVRGVGESVPLELVEPTVALARINPQCIHPPVSSSIILMRVASVKSRFRNVYTLSSLPAFNEAFCRQGGKLGGGSNLGSICPLVAVEFQFTLAMSGDMP